MVFFLSLFVHLSNSGVDCVNEDTVNSESPQDTKGGKMPSHQES